MRLIDADAVIKEVESSLNKGVYKTMIIQLIKNAPSYCDECGVVSNLNEKDWLKRFIADCCDLGAGHRVTAGELIAVYKEWARSAGEYEGRRGNEIYNAMIAAGFKRIKPRNVSTWLGLRLKTK